MSFWHRLVIAAAVFACVTLLARLVDWRLARRPLAAEAVTRYRVLRRSVTAAILFVGFFSALLVIPEVRAIAGGLLASSAVLGVIIGFASQRTLGRRRGDRPHVHVHPHRGRGAARRPEREIGLGYHQE